MKWKDLPPIVRDYETRCNCGGYAIALVGNERKDPFCYDCIMVYHNTCFSIDYLPDTYAEITPIIVEE